MLPVPYPDQLHTEHHLGEYGWQAMKIRGHRTAFAGHRDNGGEEIAEQGEALKDHIFSCRRSTKGQHNPGAERDHDDQQEEREKRPPDLGTQRQRVVEYEEGHDCLAPFSRRPLWYNKKTATFST